MRKCKCWNCGKETVYDKYSLHPGYWYCEACNTSFFEGCDENGDDIFDVIGKKVAADIWSDNGFDDDWLLGYTEEELEEELGKIGGLFIPND